MTNLLGRPLPATVVLVLCHMLAATGCSSLPPGAIGNRGTYNYSPSVIGVGEMRQVWWCSRGINPNTSQYSDAIFYEVINTKTLASEGPKQVLAESAGAWDSVYTCNPKVIGGLFNNPLGDGQTYIYAMYYVGTGNESADNSIGVAFSNDGVHWSKYPSAVIRSSSQTGYGVGQPAAYNADHKSAIRLFYEDSSPSTHHVAAVSTDGIHFQVQGTITTDGLDADDPQASWGDIAYDSQAHEWYAVFNRPLRPESTTGGVLERGQYGIELYKISQESLLTGTWKQLAIMDTNLTGFESNFIAGFVRDFYGTVNVPSYPTIQMYTSISYPPPRWDATPAEAANSAAVTTWILVPMSWEATTNGVRAFNRYFNGSGYEVTTGWIDPESGFRLEETLGYLYGNPRNGATTAFYSCDAGQGAYFVSLDANCELQRILGTQGYAYSQPISGLNLVALYRCRAGQDHFVSKDPHCEGQTTEELLGYVLP